MTRLYRFPKAAEFGRGIPKVKIYDHASPGKRVKEFFVRQVEKITWSYKLSPATINLSANDGVEEIQVLTIDLKTDELSLEVLRAIDKAIPSPILFELHHGERTRHSACYKRPSEADHSKWVISEYFQSFWLPRDAPRVDLPVALDMEALYRTILTSLSPIPLRDHESLDHLVSRIESLRSKEREAANLKNRIGREKQFNRQVDLNRDLNRLKTEIEELSI